MREWLRQLELSVPIIQAPMAGGPTTPGLVAAVCEAGGLGSIAGGYLTPGALEENIAAVRSMTHRPFAVNLFIPERPTWNEADAVQAQERLNGVRAQLGIPPQSAPAELPDEAFTQKFEIVLAARPRVLSFTFGALCREQIDALHDRGIRVFGTATTVAEGIALANLGVDAVVAQGAEAGGHRGTFLTPFADALVGTMALVPQMCDAITRPVIAAGGIMDGRGVAAALALGAAAVQMGTAFLTTVEAGTHPAYRAAILQSEDTSTTLTCAFSGKPARGIKNAFIADYEQSPGDVMPYPLQNAMTRDIRQAAGRQGDPRFMSMWAGQGAKLARPERAGELIERVMRECAEIVRDINGHW